MFPVRLGPDVTFNSPLPEDRWDTHSDGFVAKIAAYPAPSPQPGRLQVRPEGLAAGSIAVGARSGLALQVGNTGRGPLIVNIPPLPPPFSIAPSGDLRLRPAAALPFA